MIWGILIGFALGVSGTIALLTVLVLVDAFGKQDPADRPRPTQTRKENTDHASP